MKAIVILVFLSSAGSEILSESLQDAHVSSDADGQLLLNLEHSLNEGTSFLSRGTLTVHSLRSGSTSLSQNPLSEEEQEQIRHLCQKEGLYLLRIRAQTSGHVDPIVHRTVTDACEIVRAGLSDVITVHLDWRSQLVGVSVNAKPTLAHDKFARSNPTIGNFKTNVVVQQMETGPQPDTAAFIQKVEQEKLAKQRGETKDNRSFFAKYWMYIVPVVIILAMNSANPEAGQGGGR